MLISERTLSARINLHNFKHFQVHLLGQSAHVLAMDGLVSYSYRASVSPHLAARLEGNPVELSTVVADHARARGRHAFVFVAGSGELVCPIRYDGGATLFLTDIVRALKLDLLVVTPAGLGAINTTLPTVGHVRQTGLRVRWGILNRYTGSGLEQDNLRMIERFGNVPVVATVAPDAEAPTILRGTLTVA